jgi:hypothetical protein
MTQPNISLNVLSRVRKGDPTASGVGSFSCVVYGGSGTGKTTSLSTLTTDPRRTLILVTERNLMSLKRAGCDYLYIATWAELISTVQEISSALQRGNFPYEAVAWDSLTASEPLIILGLTGKEIAPLDAWKVVKARLRSLINDMADWVNAEKFPKQTIDLVITAGQDRTVVEHRETAQQLIGPDTPGKAIAPIFFRLCDCVFYSHVADSFDDQTKAIVSRHLWRTSGNDLIEAKDGTSVMDVISPQDFQILRRRRIEAAARKAEKSA